MSFQRILVALDTSSHSLAALDAAADMAARMEAELIGLFVEDINLVRLAKLPFAHEVGFPSAARRELDSVAMERMLKAVAEEARKALAATAERKHVRWSFRVARGSVVSELVAAATEADLIALGRSSQDLSPQSRLGSTALSVLAKAPSAVLLLYKGLSIRGPVLVVYGGTQPSLKTLSVAVELARASTEELEVLITTDDPAHAKELEEEAARAFKDAGILTRYHRMHGVDVARLARAVHREHAGALVLNGMSRLLRDTVIQELIERVECPVFLVK